jgi:hypothetical protein
MLASQFLIVRTKDGNLVSKSKTQGEIKEVVRKTVMDALSLWSVDSADFTVIRDPQYPVTAKSPISKEQYELYSKYELQRTSNGSVMFYLPVYIISFDNIYLEDNYMDREVFVVAPVLDPVTEEAITDLAIESTKQTPPGEEGGEGELEEGEEVEEEGKEEGEVDVGEKGEK